MFGEGYLEYLLTYKLSQNHLEMFFSAVRARGGFSNNPTAAQFEAAYKQLIIHTEIMTCSEGANCMNIDLIPILSISSTKKNPKPNSFIDILLLCYEDGESDIDDNFNEIQISLKMF